MDGRIHFAPCDRCCRCSQRLDTVNDDIAFHSPQLAALKIRDLLHRRIHQEVTQAVRIPPQGTDPCLLDQLFIHCGNDFTAQDLIQVIIISENKGKLQNIVNLSGGLPHTCIRQAHLDGAHLDSLDVIALIAQLGVFKQIDGNCSAGSFFHT